MRAAILDDETLVRAVASGRQRGAQPPWRRVELRYVDLKAGRHLQVTAYDDAQAHTSNHAVGEAARAAVDELLEQPFGNWHVDTATETHQLRVTKKREAVVHTRAQQADPAELRRDHDRDKGRLLAEDDPVFRALGLSDHEGRMKPSRQSKYRQVEEFLRILDASISDALEKGHLRTPTPEQPLEIVDLGCGNAYLTFVTERYLTHVRGLPVHLTGIDQREQSREHNAGIARDLGVDAAFVASSIEGAEPAAPPDVVLALHACDTATDDALARAVEWGTPLILAAPCCHHDIAAQLRKAPTPAPYAMLTRHGILRERFADTLTDGLRASLLRLQGYRVDVMQFVGSEHTPRNTLLRATRTGKPVTGGAARQEYDELVTTWGVRPATAASCWMPSGLVGLLVAAPFALGLAVAPDAPQGTTLFRLQDPAIVEASALVVQGDLFLTTNDSGDSGRVFAVDRTGATVGVTHWSDDPTDVEALAPAGPGQVWVADIGDNSAARSDVTITRVPVGRGESRVSATSYRLTYPRGATDAETLIRNPATGRLYLATKNVFGGILYAVPKHLSASGTNRLTRIGHVVPIATDGAFFPDGRHLVVRDYSSATVYDWPTLERVGSFSLPAQPQGEGIAVGEDDTLYLSSEGLHARFLETRVPAQIRQAIAAESPRRPPDSRATTAPGRPTPRRTTPGRGWSGGCSRRPPGWSSCARCARADRRTGRPSG